MRCQKAHRLIQYMVIVMVESVFKSRKLSEIYDEICKVYLSDNRPWILGFSGGKDSTCMVQIIWDALARLKPSQVTKKIFIISSDTLVESPKIVEQITKTLDMIEQAAQNISLPIKTNLVRPKVQDSFWVCLLGKGFPAPSNMFRWCTERLKIRNADRFIKERVSEYGEAIIVLGTRKDESGSRNQLMNLYEIKGSLLSRHSKFPQTYVYTPVRDFTATDVWTYLLQNPNPWGAKNRDLLALYQNAGASECPLVVDSNTPSCGNSRFGCWTCTVVENDASMKNTIESGEEWMQPLLELREELKDTQDPEKRKQVRALKRRDGKMKLVDEMRQKAFQERIEKSRAEHGISVTDESDPYATLVPGPYTMEFREQFLTRLLEAQMQVQQTGPDPNIRLIQDNEIHEVQRLWRIEQGDWRNTAYRIYENITGKKIDAILDDTGSFGEVEQQILEKVCSETGVSSQLVSRLLNTEHEHQNMSRHAKVFPKIKAILMEEWREDLDEIVEDLKEDREAVKKFGKVTKK